MTDLKDLLGLALDDATAAAHAGARPGVEDDLARGQRLLRRRTRNRVIGASAAAAAVAVAALVPVLTSGSNTTPTASGSHPPAASVSHSPASGSPASGTAHSAASGIKLVDYTGTQPPGYVVKVIPDHWVIQGSNPYALTIAPPNATDTNPNDFIGKLVVMQESFDVSGAQGWTSAHIPGHTAYYSIQDNIASLVIEQTASRWLDIQAPTSLHWTEQQQVQFGLGVTILPTAQEGKG